MTTYVVNILWAEASQFEVIATFGPFNKHQQANHFMQLIYDGLCAHPAVTGDDNDADIFTLSGTEDIVLSIDQVLSPDVSHDDAQKLSGMLLSLMGGEPL